MSGNITADMQAARDEAGENRSRYPVYLPTLPPSWRYERFGKILDVQGGSQPPKSQFIYEPKEGYVQLLQIRDFGERSVPTFVREDAISKTCVEDDVLIARYGASLGRIVTGKAGAYNVALAKVIYDKNLFYNRYLFYLLQTPFFQTPIHMISRSAQNGFNKGDLSDILLPMAPFQEQQQIVAEIEKQFTRLDAGVAGLRRVQANLKRYRAAVLKAACEGKLVPTEAELARQEGRSYETGAELLEHILAERRKKWNGKAKYKEPMGVDTANVPKLPEGWVWGTASQIFMEVKDGTHDTPKYQALGIPFITQKHIKPSGLVFDDFNFISKQDHDRFYERSNPVRGDILVSMIGVNRGQSCIVTTDDIFSIKNVGLFKPYHKLSTVKFLQSYFSSLLGQKLILETSKGGAQPFIGLTELRAWPIPLPPIAEQQRIVAEVERRLSVVEELEAVVNANFQRATRLRQAVLQRAFEGNLAPRYD